jgi:hypothetical protein
MSRVTKAELEQLVVVLNNRLGRPVTWGQGGHIYAGWAYGSPRLSEQLPSGGERELSPRLPTGQLAAHVRAMLIGIDLAEANIRTAAPQLNGLPGYGERPDGA